MKSLDAIREYGRAEGRAEGKAEARAEAAEGRRNIALSLIRDGLYALDKIAVLCSLPLQQVQELAASPR